MSPFSYGLESALLRPPKWPLYGNVGPLLKAALVITEVYATVNVASPRLGDVFAFRTQQPIISPEGFPKPLGASHVPRYAFFVISLAAGSGPCQSGQCDRSGTPSYAIQKHLPLLVHFLLDPFDLLFVYMTKSPLDFQVLYNGQSFEAISEVILFTIFDLI